MDAKTCHLPSAYTTLGSLTEAGLCERVRLRADDRPGGGPLEARRQGARRGGGGRRRGRRRRRASASPSGSGSGSGVGSTLPLQRVPLSRKRRRRRVAAAPRAVEAELDRAARGDPRVVVDVAGGHRGAALRHRSAPRLGHGLVAGEGPGQRPAVDRRPEVGDADVGGEAARPLARCGVDDRAAGARSRGRGGGRRRRGRVGVVGVGVGRRRGRVRRRRVLGRRRRVQRVEGRGVGGLLVAGAVEEQRGARGAPRVGVAHAPHGDAGAARRRSGRPG